MRDLQVQPRDHDLVLATHGRGIWIIDDLDAAARDDARTCSRRPSTFLPGRPVQQRMPAQAGWADGDAVFVGPEPARRGRSINYYQRSRHLFGKLKLEVLDDQGKVVDTLNADEPPRDQPRQLDDAAEAPARARAPRRSPSTRRRGRASCRGTYTLRLTDGDQTIETKLDVGLDRRAPFGVADRKAQFDAAMKARALFDDMSDGHRPHRRGARGAIEERMKALPQGDALAPSCSARRRRSSTRRRRRSWRPRRAARSPARSASASTSTASTARSRRGRARPARYQVDRIEALRRELTDVTKELDAIVARQVRPLDGELRGRKLEPIPTDGGEHAEEDEGEANGSAVAAVTRCLVSRGATCEEAVRAARQSRTDRGEKD